MNKGSVAQAPNDLATRLKGKVRVLTQEESDIKHSGIVMEAFKTRNEEVIATLAQQPTYAPFVARIREEAAQEAKKKGARPITRAENSVLAK